ncbi:MAG: MFS transporter, partial [Syntrophomonadaceae bacterium]|nr:MFS transporter [Syntrophomonadaceae bacterium]
LCGLSQTMYQLIAFRVLQGMGAGAIFTVTYTIVGDIFTLAERAKVQGWLSGVWGIASVMGPLVGGFLIDWLSWHWIFYINIPFGILSIMLFQMNYDETIEKKRVQIDYSGTLLLSLAVLALLTGFLLGGQGNGWEGSTLKISVGLFALAIIFLAAFYFVEKKAAEPVIPFSILTKTSTVVNVISFFAAAALIGADVYLPVYIQSVLGFSATISGLSMSPMSISWMLASVVLAKAIPKYGEQAVIGLSSAILLLSCLLLSTLGIQSSLVLVIVYNFIMGAGFGGAFTTMTIVIQAAVGYEQRGAATALNSLVRTLGNTIGVSIFGMIFNLNIIGYFNNLGVKGIDPNNLYNQVGVISGVSLHTIRSSLISAIHVVFTSLIAIAVLCLLLSFLLPSNLKEKAE